jgi:gliding motility-associated-like protein
MASNYSTIFYCHILNYRIFKECDYLHFFKISNLRTGLLCVFFILFTFQISFSNHLIVDPLNADKDSLATNTSPSNILKPLQALAAPTIDGVVTNAHCSGVADGAIQYTISGTQVPFTYNWSNGVSGTIYGSCWNAVEINNPGVSLTQYQVRVNLAYATGMKPDFSNIRFSNSANTVLYSYWTENVVNSVNAVFWVKVPTIPAGISQMRVSYCDPAATSLSNGFTTFEYFEDFNDGNISGWTKDCQNMSDPDETCTLAAQPEVVGYSLRLNGYAHCGGPTNNGIRVNAKRNITLPVGQYKMDISSKLFVCLYANCGDTTKTVASMFYNNAFAVEFVYVAERNQSCGCNSSIWFDERGVAITSSGLPTEVMLRADIWDCGDGYVLQDDFRVRKFSSTTPIITVGPPVTLNLTGLAAGDYTLNVVDGGGVTSTKTFTVTQPGQPSGNSAVRCGPGAVDLSATGSYTSYKWYDAISGGALLASTVDYTTNSINANTNYYVAGIGTNGCESTPRTLVLATVYPLPVVPTSADSSRCGPGSLTLKAFGAESSYNWYSNAIGGTSIETSDTYNIASISTNTIYYVSAVDAKNCESERVAVNAIVDQPSQGLLIGNDTIYEGADTEIMSVVANVGEVVEWEKSTSSTFATSSKIVNTNTFYKETGLLNTTFFRAIVKSGKCQASTTNVVEIRVNRPHVNYRDTLNSYSDQTFTSEGVLNNDVDLDGDFLSVVESTNSATSRGGTISFNSNGSFTYVPPVSFIGMDSVTYTSCDPYESHVQYCRTSLLYILIEDNRLANGGIIIYPTLSPNGDRLNDQWIIDGIEKYPDNKVAIFDRWGNLVYEEKGYDNSEEKIWRGQSNVGLTIGGGDLTEGTYFYFVELGAQIKPKSGFVVIRK